MKNTKDKLIKAIQKANNLLTVIQKANPNLMERKEIDCIINNPNGDDVTGEGFTAYHIPQITLEHILRAMRKKDGKRLALSNSIRVGEILDMWHLTKPLSDQPQELKDFLSEILV